MKILKYTFDIPKLIVDDGDVIEAGTTKETHTFTLLFKGVGLYEKLTGRALITDLSKYGQNASQIDIALVKDLARASYVKIENDQIHQNMITAEEFTKTEAWNRIGVDVDFMTQIVEMVTDCCLGEHQKATLRGKAEKK